MAVLTKEFFAKPSLRRYRNVELGEGQEARIQSLTERERAEFELCLEKAKSDREIRRRLKVLLVSACLVDQDGAVMFGPADRDALLEADSRVTALLFDACLDHCGFSQTDKKTVEKNSD